MLFTAVLLSIIICLIFYIILSLQMNKIKKDYVKNDLRNEILDLINIFTEEADKNITILENLIKEAEIKTESLEKLLKYYGKLNVNDNRDDIEKDVKLEITKTKNDLKFSKSRSADQDIMQKDSIDKENNYKGNSKEKVKDKTNSNFKSTRDDTNLLMENNLTKLKSDKEKNKYKLNSELGNIKGNTWQEKAYNLFTNGFSVEEISKKLNKTDGEVNFAIKIMKIKNKNH